MGSTVSLESLRPLVTRASQSGAVGILNTVDPLALASNYYVGHIIHQERITIITREKGKGKEREAPTQMIIIMRSWYMYMCVCT